MFHVGQKVVCVDAKQVRHHDDAPAIVEGAVYTISGHDRDGAGWPVVFLLEMPNEGFFWFGYNPSRFRPAVERKTDISIFHEILRKNTKKNRVRA